VDLEGLDDLGASLSNIGKVVHVPFLKFLTNLIKNDFETNI
jgi:hypothetical protein